MEATSGSCQHTHTVRQDSKPNLKAECCFTSDTSLQQVNHALYSCCRCRSQEELSTSLLLLLVQNGFRIFPHCPLLGAINAKDSASWSHCGTEDLSVAAPFTQPGLNRLPDMMEEEISPSRNERGSRAVCALLRSAGGCCLPAPSVPFT